MWGLIVVHSKQVFRFNCVHFNEVQLYYLWSHPSSLHTVRMVGKVLRYLSVIGPCIRLLATSTGMLPRLDRVPAMNPSNSRSGIEFCF